MPTHRVFLSNFLDAARVRLSLSANNKCDALEELVGLMGFEPANEVAILEALLQREREGSTGIGHGIAVPHCRTPLAHRLQVAYGRRPEGVDYDAIDGLPVMHIFLLIAPPIEISNDYLPVLGRIAQLGKEPTVPARLSEVTSPAEFLNVLAEQRI